MTLNPDPLHVPEDAKPSEVRAGLNRREPSPRRITAETVEHLRAGGASADLIRFAERHRDDRPSRFRAFVRWLATGQR